MKYALVIIFLLLLILIRVWKGSDLGFWVITCLMAVFGILATIFLVGWVLMLSNILIPA